MNTIQEIKKINQLELERDIAGTPASWHAKYSAAAWIYVGNLDHSLTEGDLLCVLSQYGELEDLHLVRDAETGKSKGFAFAKYEDSRSCVLAVDNLIGTTLCGRSLRVDHVENYRLPRHLQKEKDDDVNVAAVGPGHAYEGQELANEFSLQRGQDLFAPQNDDTEPELSKEERKAVRQAKRARKQERREKKERRKKKRKETRVDRKERHRSKRARRVKDDAGKDSFDADDRDEKR